MNSGGPDMFFEEKNTDSNCHKKSFTSRIEGMEGKNYHERLKELKLYSLERRRERYLIIYAWEQIENIRENIQNLETRKTGRCRKIV